MKTLAQQFAKRRKSRRKRIAAAAAATVGMACLGSSSASAVTILTGLDSTNDPVPVDHGSRAPETPNIQLEWTGIGTANWDQYEWLRDPGDGVYQLDGSVGDTHIITFTPDTGWNAAIALLDLNVWIGGGETDVEWEVIGSISGSLGDGTFTTPDDAVVSHIVAVEGFDSEILTLTLTQTSGLASYLALDNLVFDQIPDLDDLLCDFDGDGTCAVPDIDLLMTSVAAGNNDPAFDLDGDNSVTDVDRDEWLDLAAAENGFAEPYLLGDSNLDGRVDASDLNALALQWLQPAAKWSEGNYTGSGVDAQDLNAMALNWQRSISVAARTTAVPEPSNISAALAALGGLGIAAIRRQRRGK